MAFLEIKNIKKSFGKYEQYYPLLVLPAAVKQPFFVV